MIVALQSSPRNDVRIEAAKTLGKIGKGSTEAADALKAAAKESDEAVRKAAEEALTKLK